MKIHYQKYLKQYARKLRNNSTKSEVKLWLHLKGKKMRGYDFHRQKPIDRFIADFFCNKLQLVIELDGYSHQFVEVQVKDKLKDERLNKLNIHVMRFDDEEVMNDIENVLREIEGYVDEFEKNTPPTTLFRGE